MRFIETHAHVVPQANNSKKQCGSHKRGGGCERPRPGATQGGCTFDGARNALIPISDAVHIVHGTIGCTGTSWDSRGSRSSGPTLFKIGMTTAVSTVEAIMGRGEQQLFAAIGQAVETYTPSAVFIYVTCVPAMLGANVESIAQLASKRWNLPVLAVDCAGFYGNKNYGQSIAGDVLLRHVIGTREPEPIPATAQRDGIQTHNINLIGEWNVGGEFWNVAPLFDELGLRVLCTLSGDSRFRDIQTMHRSEANMVVCSKALLNLAHKLEERYRTPFFEGSFYGSKDTSNALRDFATLIADPNLIERTEKLIEREESRVAHELAAIKPKLAGKRALIFSGGFKSWSTVAAAQELGLTVVGTGIEKSTEEDKSRIVKLLGKSARMISNNDQEALLQVFEQTQADILIAGDRYIYPSLKARIPFLDLDHVRDIGYAGYTGAIEFAHRLLSALEHPVWEQARRKAPWEHSLPEGIGSNSPWSNEV